MQNKLTVIIPTRERADTLYWAIKTCTVQEYDNLEIIVSDNFSQDNTREVVETFQDKRIRYINTGKRVSMSHNWEFALSHVKEGWVTILGDDDGLAKEGLERTNQIINETNNKVITWRFDVYTWPNYTGHLGANTLLISKETGYSIRKSRFYLDKWLDGAIFTQQMPTIYKSFVHIDIINEVISKSKNKRFFNSMTPDAYSCAAICAITEDFVFSHGSIGVSGMSSHSTCASLWSTDKKLQNPSNQYFSEDNIPCHPDLGIAPSTTLILAECVYQAVDQGLLPLRYKKPYVDIINNAMKEAAVDNPAAFSAVKDACISIATKHNIDVSIIKSYEHKFTPANLRFGYNIFRKLYNINGHKYKIKNIYDMTVFQDGFLKNKIVVRFDIFYLITYNFSVLKNAFVRRVTNEGLASTLQHGWKSMTQFVKRQLVVNLITT